MQPHFFVCQCLYYYLEKISSVTCVSGCEGHGSNGTGLKIFRTAQAQKCFVLSEPRSQIFFTIETVLSLCRLSHAVWAWNDLSI